MNSALHGRSRELSLLHLHLERSIRRAQQLVVIEGDPGIGKTALLRGFAQQCTLLRRWFRHRVRVFYLRAPDDAAYEPVHHAALAATSRRFYARLGGKRQAQEVARDLAGSWLGAIPLWGNLIAAVLATTGALARRRKQRVFDAIDTVDEDIAALLESARARPLVLLLDDLERASALEIARLEALIKTADEGSRILIVGAYRPTAPGVSDPPIHAMLRRLPREQESFEHLRLPPLQREDLASWTASKFPGLVPPEAFIQWLADVTGGHPGSAEATFRHLQARGAIRPVPRGWRVETDPGRLELPSLAHSFADLSAVNPYIAEVVRTASALGQEFDAFTLAELMGRDELVVEDQLALGVHCGLLVNGGERELPGGEITTVYRFTTAHLRAALYQGLPAAQRAELLPRSTGKTGPAQRGEGPQQPSGAATR